MEVGRPVVAGDHRLAVDQERLRLDAAGGERQLMMLLQ
jgi:hypothetical protein